MKQFFALIVLLAGSPAFAGSESQGASRFEFGYLCTPKASATQSAKDMVSGTISIISHHPEIEFNTDQIPATIGISFGVHVQPKPDYAGQVTIVVTHPPMGADGVTRESWMAELVSDQYLYVGYGLSEPWELVTGDWTLSALAGTRELFSVDFDLVDPARLPDGVPICGNGGNNS